jgi:hypothetical protein
LAFLLLGVVSGLFEWSIAAWLFWPHFALVMLGLFGWMLG